MLLSSCLEYSLITAESQYLMKLCTTFQSSLMFKEIVRKMNCHKTPACKQHVSFTLLSMRQVPAKGKVLYDCYKVARVMLVMLLYAIAKFVLSLDKHGHLVQYKYIF